MANIAIFHAGQTPQYLTSVNTQDYSSDPDAIINPDVSALTAVAVKYWKRSGDLVLEMTAGEKDAVDAAAAAALTTSLRSVANDITDASDSDGVKWRALALMLLDELNSLRQWTVAFKGQVALATTLADLKTRVAGLSTLSDRTISQAKTAYSNKVNTAMPIKLWLLEID
jgi:hypothetical protein